MAQSIELGRSGDHDFDAIRAWCGNPEGGNRPPGARDSPTTGRCDVPARGFYNPLGPEYTVSSQCASRRGGEMTTQGAGFHPSEGAWRPLGTRSYRRALCANRDGARVGPKGAVFSSSDGYSHTRGPEQQHLRALELKPRDRTIKKLHMEAKEGARAPMGGRNTGSGKKMPT